MCICHWPHLFFFLLFVVALSVALEIIGVSFENIPNKLHNLYLCLDFSQITSNAVVSSVVIVFCYHEPSICTGLTSGSHGLKV